MQISWTPVEQALMLLDHSTIVGLFGVSSRENPTLLQKNTDLHIDFVN
jgi:hypothetical protein